MNIKVQKFAEAMQVELDANNHKGNWEDFKDVDEIMQELVYHKNKLDYALYCSQSKAKIKEHIADCANILMMLGNSYEIY